MNLYELLKGLHDGDPAAQREFEHDYGARMLRVARSFLRKHARPVESAKDICQTVMGAFFARAQRSEIRAESPKKLVSFVAAMIRFAILKERRDEQRARRDVRRLEDTPVEKLDIFAHEPEPGQAAEARELWEKCADELGVENAFIAYEHICEKRTFREIAEILEKKPGAVRVQLQRALEKLRAKFGRHFRPQ